MNILITGGAGYIGSVLTDHLLEAGDDVIVYDSLVMGHKQAVHPDARLVVGEVGDRELLKKTMEESGTEAVVHMAGFVNPGESMADPGKYFRNNTCEPLELLEAMAAADVGKVLFSSSCAVYGNPVSETIDEDHPKNPTNAYGESKLIYEKMLDWYDRIYGIRHVALRYFNAAGASRERGEDHTPESHLIPLVLQTALGQREFVEIFGTDYPTPDGTCIRDYIHIEDLAAAHLLALRNLDDVSLKFNLGNGRGYSVREVIETAARVSGREIRVRESDRRPGDPARLVASSRKIQSELGWQQRQPELEKIIADAWEWHSRHPGGYSSWT
ncbi:MAG: UDP-glucose 4-epimerase GalE [Actinobacteria bacterium]|nr:UDP-glucose 4-epimerase GalE [Actinomycetota bacterium]